LPACRQVKLLYTPLSTFIIFFTHHSMGALQSDLPSGRQAGLPLLWVPLLLKNWQSLTVVWRWLKPSSQGNWLPCSLSWAASPPVDLLRTDTQQFWFLLILFSKVDCWIFLHLF
jgi:hypothetical protein